MALTLTKIAGPVVVSGKGVEYSFSVACDSAFATDGESMNLTSYLSYLHGGRVEGADAIADLTRRFDVVGPGITTALTSSNVKLVSHHSSGADAVDNPADGENLSTVGALIVTVWGKAAVVASWV